MSDVTGKYYYYARERGCLKHQDSIDELGVGIKDGKESCSITIRLYQFKETFGKVTFTMEVSSHNDEWSVFARCRDVFTFLSGRGIPSGEMNEVAPFYELRWHLEQLGYKNLGPMSE